MPPSPLLGDRYLFLASAMLLGLLACCAVALRQCKSLPFIFTHKPTYPASSFPRGHPHGRRCRSRTRRGRRRRRPLRLARLADRRWPDDHAPVLRPARRAPTRERASSPSAPTWTLPLRLRLVRGPAACSWSGPTLRGLSVARGGLCCCCRCSRLLRPLSVQSQNAPPARRWVEQRQSDEGKCSSIVLHGRRPVPAAAEEGDRRTCLRCRAR